MRRIGLLGGTFDPPHVGHAILADQVGSSLGLDEVRLVVANDPWQKTETDGGREVTSAARRLEMTKALLSDLLEPGSGPALTVSDVEITIGGPSYTAATLEYLGRTEPDVEWTVVVGSDAAAGLHTWHRADELRDSTRFASVARGGHHDLVPSPGFDVVAVSMPSIEISSTDLRRRTSEGESIRFLTTPGVIALTAKWGLYRPEV